MANAQLEVIRGSGHLMMIDEPIALAHEIDTFIETLNPTQTYFKRDKRYRLHSRAALPIVDFWVSYIRRLPSRLAMNGAGKVW
jgi:hypothetical protein